MKAHHSLRKQGAALFLAAVLLLLSGCGSAGSAVRETPEATIEPPAASPLTPEQAVYEIFDAADSMTLTLFLAGEGACRSYTVTDRFLARRLEAILLSCAWAESDQPDTAPSDFWITVSSPDDALSMTFWGNSNTLQYRRGDDTVFWLASSSEEDAFSVPEAVRREFDNLDADSSRIVFTLEGSAEEAADYFVHSAYGAHMTSLAPGNMYGLLRYEVVDWAVREVSEDGEAVVGWFTCAFEPCDYDSPGIWAGNTGLGTGEQEGLLTAYREFVLQREDDGCWHCVGLGTGGYSLP